MNNNFYQNQAMYGQQPMWNTGYQQQLKPVKAVGSTLTEEEIKMLRAQNNPTFSIKPTETEIKRGACNHHHPDGTSALTLPAKNPNATATTKCCDICGRDVDLDAVRTQEEADKIVNDFCNLQEVVKFANLGMPSHIAAQLYGNTIPYNRKMAAIYAQCANEINGIGMTAGFYNRNGNLRGQQVFNTLNGGYVNGAPMYQQFYDPSMQQQPMNPAMPPVQYQGFQPYQYPQQQPMMQQAQAQQPGGNPFYAEPSQQQGFYSPSNIQQPQPTANNQQPTAQQPTAATTEQTVRSSNV